MNEAHQNRVRRFLPFNVITVAAVVIGLLATAGLSGRTSTALALHQSKIKLMASEGTLGGDPDHQGNEPPLDQVAQQQFEQRAYPSDSIPAGAYTRGVSDYNFVSDLGGSFSWKEVGPITAPNGNFPDPYSLKTTAVSGRLTALAVVPSTCSTGSCGTIYAGTANGGIWKTTNGGQSWQPLTDHQLSTAVGTLTVDPINSQIVYAGLGEPNFSGDSNHGTGILRSTDGGQTWVALGGYSQFVNRSISGLIIDPRTAGTTNATLYVTTASGVIGGATTGGSGSAPYLPARGFYYSKDGGQTWTQSNPTSAAPGSGYSLANDPAHALVMDPNNPNVLYAGFTSTGVFKSADDGLTWTELTNGLPAATRYTASRYTLAIAPSNSQVLYAAYLSPAGNEQIYKSTNAGADWTQLHNAPNACSSQCWYDMPLVVAPNDANTVYTGGMANYSWLFYGAYGAPCNTFNSFAVQCSATLMKTTDGGATWADIAENGSDTHGNGAGPVHPDNHVILVNPNDPNTIYTGTDGGLFHSANAGAAWNDLNNGIDSFQFTGIAVGPTGSIFGGTQDNGTFRLDPGANGVAVHVNGGDGGQAVADPSNASTAYYSYYGSQMLRDDDAMGPNVYPGGIPHSFPTVWISPFYADAGQFYQPRAVDTLQPNTIFAGTYRILRSTNRGGTDGNGDTDATNDLSDSAIVVAKDTSGNNVLGNWAPLSNRGTFGGGNIAAVAISPVDPNVMAIATTLGKVFLTTNALAPVVVSGNCDSRVAPDSAMHCTYVSGITWTEIDGIASGATPNRYPTSLAFAPGSSTTLYATYSGFSATTPNTPGHVFAGNITSRGTTWTNLNGQGANHSLPDLPVSSIVISSKTGHLYVAADFGVFVSTNNGQTWQRHDFKLPNTPVYQLVYDASSNSLLAATHGRGIWRAAAP